jgi:hypothetical protein
VAAKPSTGNTLRMLSGALVWALHFMTIYVFTALACARGFAEVRWLGITVVSWTIGAATTIALVAAVTIITVAMREGRPAGFNAWMTTSVAALAVVAIVWETLPALMVPACV